MRASPWPSFFTSPLLTPFPRFSLAPGVKVVRIRPGIAGGFTNLFRKTGFTVSIDPSVMPSRLLIGLHGSSVRAAPAPPWATPTPHVTAGTTSPFTASHRSLRIALISSPPRTRHLRLHRATWVALRHFAWLHLKPAIRLSSAQPRLLATLWGERAVWPEYCWNFSVLGRF